MLLFIYFGEFFHIVSCFVSINTSILLLLQSDYFKEHSLSRNIILNVILA